MNEAQQIQEQVHAAWQVCQKNSGTDGNHLPTYPTESPALEVDGRNVAGWIALPRFNKINELNGIAFIDRTRNTSVFLGSAEKNGDYFQLDATDSAQNKNIYIGNCHKQATIVSEITCCKVIVVGITETAHVVRELVENNFDPKNIVIFSSGEGIKNSKLISQQRGCGWVQMSSLGNQEINSELEINKLNSTIENIATSIHNPQYQEGVNPPLSFTQHTIKNREKHSWIVNDIISTKSFNAIYGASAAGKTFVALNLAAAISGGKKWLGKKTKKCPVLYLALESQDGFVLRMEAHKTLNGPTSLNGIHTWLGQFSFSKQSDIDQLVAHINGGGFNGGVIFLDTLARAMSGLDENSATDMGEMIKACNEITEKTNCAIILVAHSGKNQQAGLRGHSMLLGALDSAIEVEEKNNTRKLIFNKIKEGRDGMEYVFTLNVVPLGTNEDGEQISSCCVEFTATD